MGSRELEMGSSAKGTWKKAPYTAKLTLNKAGKMELEVVFSLQEYTEKRLDSYDC